MESKDRTTADLDASAALRARDDEAVHLQEMEGNPFDAEDEAMFAMFEREGWSSEQQRAYIIARAKSLTAPEAAE